MIATLSLISQSSSLVPVSMDFVSITFDPLLIAGALSAGEGPRFLEGELGRAKKTRTMDRVPMIELGRADASVSPLSYGRSTEIRIVIHVEGLIKIE